MIFLSKNIIIWVAILSIFVLGGIVFAQAVSSVGLSLLDAAIVEQRNLAQETVASLGHDPTPDALQAWNSQHAAEIQTFQKNTEFLNAQSEMQAMPYIAEIRIPNGASQSEIDFRTAQANLANGFAQIHNQQVQIYSPASLQGMGQSQTESATVEQIQTNEITLFQQQYAPQIRAQRQRAQNLPTIASPFPLPPPLDIPASASPQLKAFLTLRYNLAQAQAKVWNQNMSMDAAYRDEAMAQWQQQNTASFSQLDQLGSNLTP